MLTLGTSYPTASHHVEGTVTTGVYMYAVHGLPSWRFALINHTHDGWCLRVGRRDGGPMRTLGVFGSPEAALSPLT